MVLFSRSFVRKRMISLATTASVAATSFALADDPARTDHFYRTIRVQYAADGLHPPEQPFVSEKDIAKKKTEADRTITLTEGVDRDVVAMMVPHHQGAADMAKNGLKYGHSEQLRRLARGIIAINRKEIGGDAGCVERRTAHRPAVGFDQWRGRLWRSADISIADCRRRSLSGNALQG
jgi:hypothetical protein